MKKRSMILALASMLGISAAATAVSGFAWFTTQTTAQITSSTYQVGASQGSLKIEAVAADVNCSTGTISAQNVVAINPTTDGILADVSSRDGKNFYQLTNIINKTDEHSADFRTENAMPASGAYTSVVNTKQLVAVSWKLKVSNTSAQGAKLDVYLSNNGAIFTNAATGENAPDYHSFYRLAVLDESDKLVYLYADGADGTLGGLVAGDEVTTDHTYNYTAANGWDGKTAALVGGTDCVTKDQQHVITSSSSTGVVAGTSAPTAKDLLLIRGLDGGTNVTLKFVVWCEGTATPEAAANTANLVNLAIDMVGIA